MNKIVNIFKKDFKRRVRSPWGIVILLVIPIIMTSMFGAVFGGGSSKNIKIKIFIEDRDNTFFSNLIVKIFDSPDVKKFIEAKTVKDGTGEDMIREKKASALLIIPVKFSQNFFDGKKSEFVLIKNPAEQFFPPVIEDLSSMMTKLLSAVLQVFSDELKQISMFMKNRSQGIEKFKLEKIFSGSYDKIKKVSKFIFPPLISFKSINVNKKTKEASGLNIFSMLLPPISVMFLMFIIEIFLRDILQEKEDGTMQRILYSPVKSSTYIVAKILSGWIMGILMFFILVVFGMVFFGINWGNYLFLLLLVVITAFAISSFFAFINSIFRDKKQASSITAPLILIMSAAGGSMVPYSLLPPFVKKFSFLSINFWFMDGSNKVLSSKFPLMGIIVLGIMGIVFFAISVKILIKRIAE